MTFPEISREVTLAYLEEIRREVRREASQGKSLGEILSKMKERVSAHKNTGLDILVQHQNVILTANPEKMIYVMGYINGIADCYNVCIRQVEVDKLEEQAG